MLSVIISVRLLKGEEQNKEAGNITLPASFLILFLPLSKKNSAI